MLASCTFLLWFGVVYFTFRKHSQCISRSLLVYSCDGALSLALCWPRMRCVRSIAVRAVAIALGSCVRCELHVCVCAGAMELMVCVSDARKPEHFNLRMGEHG